MRIIINKKLNLLVFLAEISSLRKNPWNSARKRQWIQKSGGQLNKEEKEYLNNFKKLLSGFNYNYLEAQFIVYKGVELRNRVAEYIGTDQAVQLNKILSFFSHRFEKLWKNKVSRLAMANQYFSSDKFKEILFEIKKISGSDFKDISIYLIMSSNNQKDILGWFSALENRIDIVLECSFLDKQSKDFIILVVTHELLHLAIHKNQNLKRKIKRTADIFGPVLKNFSEDMNPAMILEELLISSFAPEGFFLEYFFKRKIRAIGNFRDNKGEINFVLARRFCGYKMKNIAKEYLDSNKMIDEQYLLRLIEAIK